MRAVNCRDWADHRFWRRDATLSREETPHYLANIMEYLQPESPCAGWTPALGAASLATPVAGGPGGQRPTDRAGIKNSFQSLFSPNVNVGATPSFLSRGGLTPFINGGATPGLVMPTPGMMGFGSREMSSPFLQAAAKEAVRREFMNMPSYVGVESPEHGAPGSDLAKAKGTPPVFTKDGLAVPVAYAYAAGATGFGAHPAVTSAKGGEKEVEGKDAGVGVEKDGEGKVKTEATEDGSPASGDTNMTEGFQAGSAQQKPSVHQFAQHPQVTQGVPPGMVVIGQHGQMMMAPPGMYAPPPGMMVFHPGPHGQGGMMAPPGMMMHPYGSHGPHASHMAQVSAPIPKNETPAQRKVRVEREKQELNREFKKKTREAALVRFRQKRRERRFGKLIRYDCRKKLADQRPRVKGRFTRVKEDEPVDAQVVPSICQ